MNTPTSPISVVTRAREDLAQGLERQIENLGIRRFAVLAPEILDAALREFVRLPDAETKHWAEIGISRRSRGFCHVERCQRQTGIVYSGRRHNSRPSRIDGDEHAPAQILARKIEERFERLQHRRLDPREAPAREEIEKPALIDRGMHRTRTSARARRGVFGSRDRDCGIGGDHAPNSAISFKLSGRRS